MAMRFFVLRSGLFLALVLAGCSSRPQLVENLPPPNFNGPNIAPQAARPLPNLPAPTPTPQPAPAVIAGIPREWLPQAGATRAWKWIIIHHSATPSGSARRFDRMHREKGWDELGYHFVIGNGTESGDGHIEVGPRWPKQKWGAHAKTPDNRYNDFGIGICLVGNFDIERPTAQQTRSLARLTAYLMRTYNIPPERILGHGETKPTDCPGRNISIAAIRRLAIQMAESGEFGTQPAQIAGSVALTAPAEIESNASGQLLRSATLDP